MWRRLHLKHLLKNKKGYTLIELLVSISLMAVILLIVSSLINFSIITSSNSYYRDEILSKGRYSFEYISGEIRRADKIIDTNKINGFNSKYPDNLGFIIYNYNDIDKNPKGNYEYTSYYIGDDVLYRIKCRKIDEKYPSVDYFIKESGINFLSDNIWENNTMVDFQANNIILSFIIKDYNFSYEFESVFNMNCPTDY